MATKSGSTQCERDAVALNLRYDSVFSMSAATPLSRIYFDTNPLFGWPSIPRTVQWLAVLAKWLSVKLYIPEAVEVELEEQFIRRVVGQLDQIAQAERSLTKLLASIGQSGVAGLKTDLKAVRTEYGTTTARLRASLGLESIPIATPPATDLLRMAASRTAPFEEMQLPKGETAVTGFQDAVIFFSILGHISSEPVVRSGLVSNDKIFRSSEVKTTIQARGADLDVFTTVDAVANQLWERVSPSIREGWENDFEKAHAAVLEALPRLVPEILRLISIQELESGTWGKILNVTGVRVESFQSVRTDLPEVVLLPPFVPSFTRKIGPTRIEATVTAMFDAVVQPMPSIFLPEQLAEALPRVPEAKSVYKTLDLVLEADYDGSAYRDVRLVGATLHR